MKANPEYEQFNKAMDTILRADPKAVKEAMEAEKRERTLEAERTGRRGRGRPPKNALPSSRAPS
jgi:hypothetical protein